MTSTQPRPCAEEWGPQDKKALYVREGGNMGGMHWQFPPSLSLPKAAVAWERKEPP